jgi:VWFA-related protein
MQRSGSIFRMARTTAMASMTVMVSLTAVLFASRGSSLSAQQAGPDQTPAFRSGIEVVTVDVGVVDKHGLPLRGLTPADFVVTVAGQPRRVVTVEFVDRASAHAAGRSAPEVTPVSTNEGSGTGRLFAFIVDQNTLDLGSARRVAAATGPFFSQLTFADRSALMLLPLGPNVAFTWAHDRVKDGLQRVAGMGRPSTGWDYGSLADARDIANRNFLSLSAMGARECGSISASGIGSAPSSPGSGIASPPSGSPAPGGDTPPGGGTSPGGGTQPGGGTGGSGTPAPAGGSSTGGGGSGSQRSGSFGGGFGLNSCTRDIQMQAESAWRSAQMNSLASISALRQFLAMLGRVRGDKTVILVSGGWPLDDREEMSILSQVAADAAAARATVFSVFVPASSFSADRRFMTSTPLADNYLHLGPLETLAGMTGGGSFRAEVGAEAVFERLARELAGYYRIGIEKDPTDRDGKGRRMKVQVPRADATVRAREIFDVRTYEDRDWAARLASAVDGPIPATDVGLRVTSYLSADPDDGSRRRLLVSGEALRAQPGEATLRLLVSDLQGKKITAGEVPLAHADGDSLPFSTNIAVPPGTYIVRVAVIDSAGRVGSVDHRVEARDVPLGALNATGPVLVRVPRDSESEPRLALDGVRQDERLAIEVDLEGDKARLEGAGVEFEIAATSDGPALVHAPAALSPGPREGSMFAQGVADMRVLPPGAYVIRARVTSGSEALGDVRRGFAVMEAPRLVAVPAVPSATIAGHTTTPRPVGRLPVVAPPKFVLNEVLSPPILGAFLDRVAARPDASSPAVHELLERARTTGLGGLVVSDAVAAKAPAGAFLKGLTLLSERKLEAAAGAFRDAMRESADFYPAMVYLGACYAAGGKDKEAAGAWRTALIREGDAPALHIMLADALLRQNRGDLAVEGLETARARWPEDQELKRRFAVAALLAGQPAKGLQALDELVEKRAEDEPSLALGLLMLYEAFESRQPIETADQDRARMLRLAGAYRTRGGPSLALIDTWVAAATRKE